FPVRPSMRRPRRRLPHEPGDRHDGAEARWRRRAGSLVEVLVDAAITGATGASRPRGMLALVMALLATSAGACEAAGRPVVTAPVTATRPPAAERNATPP